MSEKIIFFTKYPRLGKVKTRLAAMLGNNKAFAVYNLLLKQNWNVLRETGTLVTIEFTPIQMTEQIKQIFPEAAEYSVQFGNTIGDRMANAFSKAFSPPEIDKVILVGSDLVDLQPSDINIAFLNLTDHDVVIGPASDGGYYLIGFNRTSFSEKFFIDIPWSNANTYHETEKKIHSRNASLFILPERNDIDTLDDINLYLEDRKSSSEFAEKLQKIIKG